MDNKLDQVKNQYVSYQQKNNYFVVKTALLSIWQGIVAGQPGGGNGEMYKNALKLVELLHIYYLCTR
ncbi:MAG: hypothetical protein GXC72_13915 [Chitinophagaceae bacterium]|jgi:hypothetical protein|nr:hypothetical protein [Chitinophagaceae bacterium]